MERKASTARSDLEEILADETAEPKALPLSLLQDITGDFSDDQQIGSGGFAVVYKGMIGNRAVAVKRLSNALMDETEFHREVQCLMRVKHKNMFMKDCFASNIYLKAVLISISWGIFGARTSRRWCDCTQR
uniref:Serine-threonine/tyrosine-protein kinase catalytic domain-containing protein n=1 Tax=Aegilops tauschii subsp. strangulata TaxID=200361 RepID=A0A453M700_AEGTS